MSFNKTFKRKHARAMLSKAVVTPWVSTEEWLKVARWIIYGSNINRNNLTNESGVSWDDIEKWPEHDTTDLDPVKSFKNALEEISVWKIRTDRLPAGVETTMCLLQGALAMAKIENDPNLEVEEADSICLALSTAVNRFLNLISHTGFHLFELKKYYDVAERFGIPDWIVDVRHESTHGCMPSRRMMTDALAFCIKVSFNNSLVAHRLRGTLVM